MSPPLHWRFGCKYTDSLCSSNSLDEKSIDFKSNTLEFEAGILNAPILRTSGLVGERSKYVFFLK